MLHLLIHFFFALALEALAFHFMHAAVLLPAPLKSGSAKDDNAYLHPFLVNLRMSLGTHSHRHLLNSLNQQLQVFEEFAFFRVAQFVNPCHFLITAEEKTHPVHI